MLSTIEIDTSEGRIRGTVDEGMAIFRGVPYAQPPVASLRFMPPSSPRSRMHVFDATATAAICPQPPSRLSLVMGEFSGVQDENCLTLTIWSPRPLDRARPVLVWFHGGGYSSGGAALPWYDGERLAREHGIVVVNVNYRLGALGYLFKPGLCAGNMGLHDQIQALRWIQANAARFGGDAGHVTVMGQSAGSHSIGCILAMHGNRPLVRRAIMLSTAFGVQTLSSAEASASTSLLCAQLQIDPDRPDALKLLQQVSVERILEAQVVVMKRPLRAAGDLTPSFGPTATGALPGGAAFDRAMRDAVQGMEILVSTTSDESAAFYGLDPRMRNMDLTTLDSYASTLFGESSQERIARARDKRSDATAFELLCAAQTENYFAEGAESLALAAADGSGAAWMLRFDWYAPGSGLGACHCIDIPFVFGTFDAFRDAPMLAGAGENVEELSRGIRQAIARFVKVGIPDGDMLPAWPRFTRDDPAVMVMSSTMQVERAGQSRP